jgi:hypothetical protein
MTKRRDLAATASAADRSEEPAAAPARRPNRLWLVPPAIQREADETIEGSHVLHELPDEPALQLWTALRDVTLWAAVDPARRAGLFAAAAPERRLRRLAEGELDPELEVPLAALAAVAREPAGADAGLVTLACMRVSAWGEARGAYGTAVAFAQAAALASPERAWPAYTVGRVALAWDRLPRAESWLRRAVGLARRGEEWEAYTRAYVELGVLHARRGAHRLARRHLAKGLRAARRHGLLEVRAAALHGLFRLALETGDLERADRLSRAAAGAYGREHPRIADLLYDLAAYSLARGRAGRAVLMLERVLAVRTEAAERVPVLALLARAAALTGDARLYEEAWSSGWALATADPPAEHAAALLDLARAAEAREDWLRVEQAARALRERSDAGDAEEIAGELERTAAAARQRRRE